MKNKNENYASEFNSREELDSPKGISFIRKILETTKITQLFLYKNMEIYDDKIIYPIWCDLMDKESVYFHRLGIKPHAKIEPPQEKPDTRQKSFQRFKENENHPYFATFPIYFTILYCNSKTIDEIIASHSNTVTYSFKPALRKELIAFCEEINLDENLTEEILDSDNENYLLPLLISVFFFERFENQEFFALMLESFYFELIYKNRYLNYLYELTKKNEISVRENSGHMRINEYYILPTIYPKLCNDKINHIRAKIICGPGCGKTTAFRALIAACINEDDNKKLYDEIVNEWMDKQLILTELFPIYIDSTNIDAYNEAILGPLDNLLQLVIIDNLEEHNNALRVINNQIKQEKDASLLVLIDGLDEVRINNRLKLAKLINIFVKKHPNVNIIIASRQINFEDYEHDEFGHTIDAICDLKETTLSIVGKEKAIITKWARILGKNDAWIAETDRFILNDEYLNKLSNNPYLLAHMVCELSGGLYSTYSVLDRLVDKLIQKRRSLEELTPTQVRTLLSYIAWDMIISGSDSIHRDILKNKYDDASTHSDIICIDRKEWNKLSDEINTRAGLIIYDDTECSYSFQYKVIHKFLAAEWLLKWLEKKNNRTIYINNPNFYIMKYIKPVLENLWTKLCQNDEDRNYGMEIWRDIVIMMMVEPRWDNDIGQKAIVPIFNYLVSLSSKSLDTEQIKCICNIFEAMCLENFSPNAATKNKSATHDNRKVLLRVLYNNRNLIDMEKCKNKWSIEFKELVEENLIITE